MSTQNSGDLPRLRQLARAYQAKRRIVERERQSNPRGGLLCFVRCFWSILEPQTPFVEGWAFEAICSHLEAVTRGEITRLLINVPPGFSKSLLTDVFWPAWEWTAMGLPHLRYVAFSYAAHLTERDNGKFRDLLRDRRFQAIWGDKFTLTEDGKVRVANDKTGWKFASSVGGVGTGERGNRVILDDPHNVKEAESEAVRTSTVRWFQESMSNRLNDLRSDAIVVIMQRVHEADVSGVILADRQGYEHLMIPMEYEEGRHCQTRVGWSDPRRCDGELAWPERFDAEVLRTFRSKEYLWAGQYQQRPSPRGGGIFKEGWWQVFDVPTGGAFPAFDLVIASLDPAYTEKQENDYSALTVWGVYKDRIGHPRIMLVDAWQKRLVLHGPTVERDDKEGQAAYDRRSQPHWGLVEWVAYTCTRRKVGMLLIEAKASGLSVAQEVRRLYHDRSWGIQTVDPKGDKWARAHSVTDLFSDGLIFAPGEDRDGVIVFRDWAQEVMDQMSSFPKGAHDDLVDSATQALKWLRENGFAIRREECAYEDRERAMYRKAPQPLYPV